MVVYMGTNHETVEEKRLAADKNRTEYWKRFGPYLSERQWATVREDYSDNGDAWSNFPFDHARSRVYRWGEDGIGGISDNHQFMCMSFAFWNEEDDILKERLFGLTGHQGNHGEDVKEMYYYLDSTPTHSYMKYLYKYPQRAFPYQQLIDENGKRDRLVTEYELTDTDAFKDDRYWDIYIEYAKDDAEEILMRVTAYNRGPEPAPLHIVPQMWFRNTWSWGIEPDENKPHLEKVNATTVKAHHWNLGERYMQCSTSPGVTSRSPDVEPTLLFTDNETNKKHLYNVENESEYVKDAFHFHIVDGKKKVLNPANKGTKVGAHYQFDDCPPNDCVVVRLKLTNKTCADPIDEEAFDDLIDKRRTEADDFYWRVSPMPMSDDLRNIQRQALAGMMWNKQYYQFIWEQWANGDPTQPAPPPGRKNIRNQAWRHLHIDDVLSMPDKWEYPFFAVWDTAFHCIPLAMIDPEFAKKQLDLITREWYMHPNGQIPAYEWNFSDVNPPVHAWAVFRVFKMERKMYGREDLDFLERVFQKLLLNFTWWVNRKDNSGRNLFEGGFLGLDNIGLFNRSEALPTGGTLMQADGTSWMAFYCLNMLNIALELSKHRRTYEDIASKFFEHFLLISDAMSFKSGDDEEISLWNEEDGFYYDAITWGGPYTQHLPIKSLVGLMPLYATMTLEPEIISRFPSFKKRLDWFVKNRSTVVNRNIASISKRGKGERLLLALVSKDRLVRILEKMLDEDEFLSDYGIRSLSKYHEKHPYSMHVNGEEFKVDFVPGDSNSGLFGGNSNWRGPIWLATTFLLIESLQRFYMYYGETLKVECPKGSGEYMHLGHVAEEIQHRVQHLFAKDDEGRRACNGSSDLLDYDPHFRDHVLFHEFFHADDGRGLGACHQLGWTGLVAKMIHDTGMTCRLPMTPRTPSTAAAHYFDDTFGKMKAKPHHERRGTGRSIGNRSDIDTERDHEEEEESKSIKTNDGRPMENKADEDLIGHISGKLETLQTKGFAGLERDEMVAEGDDDDYESKLDL
ncbi:Six-hairpin glycosidase-like protein [Protomyces lactucae-debilis]|uniref:Mannosyl-oligosaccharide glucosidase n=1 Tax=Protomyces lactucae-debilis TaxID=2754530 RepID=A0A1Y2FBG1_PROLT|nr:Six-hairpin glycosidase-like protein [Protomyces lactucae-debilis]ORY80784.1 Six-hairpin glycosidase-like protein [Protomyces lactucae-debilis]